jgi:hypothetical protein
MGAEVATEKKEVPDDRGMLEGPAGQTHCRRKHLQDDASTYIDSKGYSQCLKCRRIRQRDYQRRKREMLLVTIRENRPWIEQHEPIEPF